MMTRLAIQKLVQHGIWRCAIVLTLHRSFFFRPESAPALQQGGSGAVPLRLRDAWGRHASMVHVPAKVSV